MFIIIEIDALMLLLVQDEETWKRFINRTLSSSFFKRKNY